MSTLAESHGAYDASDRVLSELDESLRLAESETAQLQNHVAALPKQLVAAQNDAAATTQLIASLTAERDKIKGGRDRGKEKLMQMERCVGVLGVAQEDAISVPAENTGACDHNPAGVWARYQEIRKEQREGKQGPNAARSYWEENKVVLEKHARSRRDRE